MKKKNDSPLDKWLCENWQEGNILPPPLDAQTAINLLRDELLGEDWYTPIPVGPKQINTEIVCDLVSIYSHKRRLKRLISKIVGRYPKKAHWKRIIDKEPGKSEAVCDNCGREVVYQVINEKWAFENFCPHCGCRMKKKRKNI